MEDVEDEGRNVKKKRGRKEKEKNGGGKEEGRKEK